MMSALQVKLLICLIGMLAIVGAVIRHNVQIVHDNAVRLSQAEAKPFDGGSTRRALQNYIPK